MPPDQALIIGLAIALLAAVVAGLWLVSRRGAERPVAAGPRSQERSDETVGVSIAELLELADWLSIGLLHVNGSGRVTQANDTGHVLLGRPPGSLAGLSTMEAFVDHRIAELTREARTRGSALRELAFPGEPQRTLLVRARKPSAGTGLWLTLHDVSELRRLQRIRTEFIDNLSHELRTPLTTVRLLVETLGLEQQRTELPPRVQDALAKIDIETGHLAEMVNELLDLARIEQGEAPLDMVEVDLGRVIESTLDRLRLYAERHGVRLRGELPGGSDERIVRGDEQRLSQLLMNLLHNAVKFSAGGDEVVVRLRSQAGEVIVEVEDRGVGIPAAELERIFERFYKVDRARHRQRGGTGLGLAIARHITERHGGRISAASAPGVGSRFTVALPREGSRADAPAGDPAHSH